MEEGFSTKNRHYQSRNRGNRALHSNFPFDRTQSWIGDADELFMEWASSVPMVASSEHARNANAETFTLNFVGVVHHGLSMAQYRLRVKQPEDFFVWLGHFVPAKGPHLAIEAARKAKVPLVLAGIIDHTRSLSLDFFNNVFKPRIDDQQVQYIGPVNTEKKINLLSRARGFLNPVKWEEPFGMVMIEAMAVGCPVISFNRGSA
ncbi:MAG TPA: glycosyltransferase [Ktedonobacteraceae bacterium]|nr:glycosyltransferase [Ktedonobacteraceae bacterium]